MSASDEIKQLDSIVDALHARIATLEADKTRLASALETARNWRDVWNDNYDVARDERDEAQWQAFAMVFEAVGAIDFMIKDTARRCNIALDAAMVSEQREAAALARAATAERDRDSDAVIIAAMKAALEWVIENDAAEHDEAGTCEEECCETPMIAACRAAVALDADRRATTGDAGVEHSDACEPNDCVCRPISAAPTGGES